MSLGTTQFKNRAEAMDPWVPVEGIYVLGTTGIESIAEAVTPGTAYSGAGALTVTVVKGQVYFWTKGGSDSTLTNGPDVLIASGTFTAAGTTVTLKGTNSATVTALVTLQAFWQKLWLYPGKGVTAGILTPNGASVNVGKSGALAPQYLPDTLAASDGPMVYQLPAGQKVSLSQVILKGSVGDGVFYSFT